MKAFKQIGIWLVVIASGYFCYLMILITIQYIPYSTESAFLALKTNEVKLLYYRLAFHIHVYTSIFVLIIGFIQFSPYLRHKYPTIHRQLGKAYAGLILLLATPSGLIMGIHGNGGLGAQISFCIQAVLWFIFTYYAILAIKKGKVNVHRNYMMLSFALTLSAISLRLFKWIIVSSLQLRPMDTYQIVVWAGWMFNIAVALVIIGIYNKKEKIR